MQRFLPCMSLVMCLSVWEALNDADVTESHIYEPIIPGTYMENILNTTQDHVSHLRAKLKGRLSHCYFCGDNLGENGPHLLHVMKEGEERLKSPTIT